MLESSMIEGMTEGKSGKFQMPDVQRDELKLRSA
jgi:hypothetical protein